MGGQGAAFAAFVTAALTIALLMLALAFLVGAAQERVINFLKGGTQQVKQWGGVILMLVGAWLIALALWASFFAQVFPV